jgi:hypothetical protein
MEANKNRRKSHYPWTKDGGQVMGASGELAQRNAAFGQEWQRQRRRSLQRCKWTKPGEQEQLPQGFRQRLCPCRRRQNRREWANGDDLDVRILSMEKTVGSVLYRNILREYGRVNQPKLIRDPAVKRTVLQML